MPHKSGANFVPDHFPSVVHPEDNAFTEKRFELGKALFFEPMLSRDSSVSCASCHKPQFAFADNLATSPGAGNAPGSRNSPSLANVAYQPYFTREGGVPTLEMQVLVPLQEHNEFDFNIVDAARRLANISKYVEASLDAYGQEINAFVITRAISVYERALISGGSRYDSYVYNGDLTRLTEDEIAGMRLFNGSKTNCTNCHSGIFFTNNSFKNNGLYRDYADMGRMRLTSDPQDQALFKVPSLRNVEVTAPYMHDGSLPTLESVVQHYNSGGKGHVNQNESITPLHLSTREIQNLVAFLKALTDKEFLNNEKLRN